MITGPTREVGYFCPHCQSNELRLETPLIASPDQPAGVLFECKLCGTRGAESALIGALAPENENFWNSERIGNLMINVTARHAAGPIIQALEHIGLLPKMPGTDNKEAYASAQAARDHVMQNVVAAAVQAAFITSAQVTPQHYAKFGDPTRGSAERTFKFGLAPAEVSDE